MTILLDNSLSSSAKIAPNEKSILERMKEEILYLAEDYSGSSFDIYATSPELKKLNSRELGVSGLENILEDIELPSTSHPC